MWGQFSKSPLTWPRPYGKLYVSNDACNEGASLDLWTILLVCGFFLETSNLGDMIPKLGVEPRPPFDGVSNDLLSVD